MPYSQATACLKAQHQSTEGTILRLVLNKKYLTTLQQQYQLNNSNISNPNFNDSNTVETQHNICLEQFSNNLTLATSLAAVHL